MGRMGKFTASDLTRLQNQLNKIQAGELPPMSQVNMEVIKWGA